MKKSEMTIKIEDMEKRGLSFCDEFFLLRQIPPVLRARGFRLYLSNRKRLVDLWLNGGAAVLGHTPANILREIKNTASRGLYAPFPHFTEGRYLKALQKIFPGRSFRLYAAPPQELVSLFHSGNAKLWRPFNYSPIAADETSFLVPVIPGIQTWHNGLPAGLCIAAAESEDLLTQLPPSDILSPILFAAAARGIYDLLASPQRGKPELQRVKKALKISDKPCRWKSCGIYLTLKENPNVNEYAAIFHQFLDAGFLLPPVSTHPLILPGELSAGEDAKLAAALTGF